MRGEIWEIQAIKKGSSGGKNSCTGILLNQFWISIEHSRYPKLIHIIFSLEVPSTHQTPSNAVTSLFIFRALIARHWVSLAHKEGVEGADKSFGVSVSLSWLQATILLWSFRFLSYLKICTLTKRWSSLQLKFCLLSSLWYGFALVILPSRFTRFGGMPINRPVRVVSYDSWIH